jgi:hypothetical protein
VLGWKCRKNLERTRAAGTVAETQLDGPRILVGSLQLCLEIRIAYGAVELEKFTEDGWLALPQLVHRVVTLAFPLRGIPERCPLRLVFTINGGLFEFAQLSLALEMAKHYELEPALMRVRRSVLRFTGEITDD